MPHAFEERQDSGHPDADTATTTVNEFVYADTAPTTVTEFVYADTVPTTVNEYVERLERFEALAAGMKEELQEQIARGGRHGERSCSQELF